MNTESQSLGALALSLPLSGSRIATDLRKTPVISLRPSPILAWAACNSCSSFLTSPSVVCNAQEAVKYVFTGLKKKLEIKRVPITHFQATALISPASSRDFERRSWLSPTRRLWFGIPGWQGPRLSGCLGPPGPAAPLERGRGEPAPPEHPRSSRPGRGEGVFRR